MQQYYTTVVAQSIILLAPMRKVACLRCIKTKALKIDNDSSFTKLLAFTSEYHGSFGYDLENGGHV
jgi:hypothetical protein